MSSIKKNKLNGLIYAYRDQIAPVQKMASYWFVEMSSAGLSISPMLDMVIIHLKVGAQKKTNRDYDEF